MIMDGLGILAAALSAFALGGVWYAPFAFQKPWRRLAGLSEEAMAARNPAIVFGGAFLLSLLSAAVFAIFLGPDPSLRLARGAGGAAGGAWVAAGFARALAFYTPGLAPAASYGCASRLSGGA